MSLDFPAFALSEEHEALRDAVRALADDKIAPRAAEIDESGEFPWDVHEALAKAELTAVLIPAVNKLGTVPLLLAGSEEVKQAYLPPVARGEAMFSYALSEPEAGSDAA